MALFRVLTAIGLALVLLTSASHGEDQPEATPPLKKINLQIDPVGPIAAYSMGPLLNWLTPAVPQSLLNFAFNLGLAQPFALGVHISFLGFWDSDFTNFTLSNSSPDAEGFEVGLRGTYYFEQRFTQGPFVRGSVYYMRWRTPPQPDAHYIYNRSKEKHPSEDLRRADHVHGPGFEPSIGYFYPLSNFSVFKDFEGLNLEFSFGVRTYEKHTTLVTKSGDLVSDQGIRRYYETVMGSALGWVF